MGFVQRLGAAALIAASCSGFLSLASSQVYAQAEVRILAAASGSGLGITAMAKSFNLAQSEVRVVVEQVPPGDSYAQTVFTQLQAGAGPDLFLTNAGYGAPESMLPIAEAGNLADLSGRPWAAKVPASQFKGFWLKDKLYGLPLTLMSVGYVYNAELLKKEGVAPPSTFQQLLSLCDTAAAKGKTAVGVSGTVSFYFWESMAVNTVFVDDPDWSEKRRSGAVKFADSEGWVTALERVQQMQKHKCFQPGVQAASTAQLFSDLVSENAWGAIGPTSLMGAVVKMRPDIKLVMIPVPNDTAERAVALGIFNEALSLNNASKNKEAAAAFLDYLFEPGNLAKYAAVAGGTAPMEALSGKFPPELTAMAPYVAAGKVRPVPHHEWKASEMRGILNQSGSAFFAGSRTIKEFLSDLDAAWR